VLSQRLASVAPLILGPIAWLAATHPARPLSDALRTAVAPPEAQPVERSDKGLGCTMDARAGLIVIVASAAGAPICNAQVRATRNGQPESLEKSRCKFMSFERPGTFALAVSAPGFQSANVDGIVVEHDQCHVIARPLIVTLHSPGWWPEGDWADTSTW